ncbi:MAG: thiol-activated cytolysin family protein [Planctomycetota bacterium]
MNKRSVVGCVLATVVCGVGCGGAGADDGGGAGAAGTDSSAQSRDELNGLLSECSPKYDANEERVDTPLSDTTYPQKNNSYFECKETRSKGVARYKDIVVLEPHGAALWPGNVIPLKDYVETGRLTTVPLPRAPVKLVVLNTLLDAESGASADTFSSTIDEPDDVSVNAEIQRLLSTPGLRAPANVEWQMSDLHTEQQTSRDFGFSVSANARFKLFGAGTQVRAFFSTSTNQTSSSERSVVIFQFTQKFFSIVMNTPKQPADYFALQVGPEEVKRYVDCGSPLAAIKSVTYGRRVYVRVESSSSAEEVRRHMQAGLSASIDFGKNGGGVDADTQAASRDFFAKGENQVKGFIAGGDDGAGAVAVAQGWELLQTLGDYLGKGFSASSPGVPIGFALVDAQGRDVAFGDPYDFTIPECERRKSTFYVDASWMWHNARYQGGLAIASYRDNALFDAIEPVKQLVAPFAFPDNSSIPPGTFWSEISNAADMRPPQGASSLSGLPIKVSVPVAAGARVRLSGFAARERGGIDSVGPTTIAEWECAPSGPPVRDVPECTFTPVNGAPTIAASKPPLSGERLFNANGQGKAFQLRYSVYRRP